MTRSERAARAYADRGWLPLPLNWVDHNGACSCGRTCGNPGKHPRVRWKDRTEVDLNELRRWWRWWPPAGVGIKTGPVSGLLVLDVDPRHGGDESLAFLEAEHGPLPETLSVATGGGGRHFYFASADPTLRNDQAGKLGPGLDIRGHGGQVVAPPTLHVSSRRYRWVDWRAPVADPPAWLVNALRPAPVPPARPLPLRHRRGARAYGAVAMENECDRVRAAPQRWRNNQLNQSAYSLGRLVGAGLLDAVEVGEELLEAGLDVGLEPDECRETILSGLRAGAARPRSVS